MSLHIITPGDFRVDPGDQQKLYPIEPVPEYQDVVYDKYIQKTSYIQANIVGCFNDWIKSFFPPDYFKFVRIRTQSSFAEFKSLMKNIYKKEKPFMIIDPRSIEHDENSLFGQNMINRYNLIDPNADDMGAKLLYSIEIMKDDMFELVYRRNRFRFEFDILIMEQTLHRQINTYNMLLMNIRHNSKFLLARKVPHLIPSRYIINIARLHGYDYKSEEFLSFLNTISQYPIIRRITPNGQYSFYMEQQMNLQIEVPGIPAKDTPEMSEAIEWGARITDSFIIYADLPTEFLYLTPSKYLTEYDRSIPEDPDTVSFISPVYADMDWPTEFNGYTLTNRVDVVVQEGDKTFMNLLGVIETDTRDREIFETLKQCVDMDGKLSDLMAVKVYPNGSMIEANYTFDEKGVLTLIDPKYDKLYTVNIYLNMRNINLIRSGKDKKYIGTIEQY